MPCDCSHLEANQWEEESRVVAGHLAYVLDMMGRDCPNEIRAASVNYYGNPKKANEWTAYLCKILSGLPEKKMDKIVYNGKSKKARSLADWWESHMAVDREKKKAEEYKAKKDRLVAQAIKKLTHEELNAIRESN